MVEFCLAIPLLAAVIVVTWFFGWAMKNQQKVRTAARHAAWSHQPDGELSAGEYYNERFFNESAENITILGGSGPVGVLDDFSDEVAIQTGAGYALAGELIDRFVPLGWRRQVSADFPSSVGLWQRFQGAIHGRHLREGVSWRRNQLGYSRLLREQYVDDLDDVLDTVGGAGQGLADMIRRLYRGGW
jgi:hypothetical protein